MTELDFDRLGNAMENLRTAWDSLTPEQKADALNKVDSAMSDAGAEEADAAGSTDQSEFQRMGAAYLKAAGYLELAAVASLLAVATAPAAPFLVAMGTICLIWGTLGNTITIQRAKDIGSWLAAKHPKAYAIFCENPGLLYGEGVMRMNPDGPWYMMHSCSVDGMLTAGSSGIVAPGDITSAASIPDYPNWVRSSSATDSSSSLVKFGLIAGAAYLILK